MKTLPLIPTLKQLEGTPAEDATPDTLCANWKDGCNGVTDGPEKGRLCLCDYCKEESE